MKAMNIPEKVRERAATRYVEVDGCWISTYSTQSSGYAQIGWTDEQAGHMTLAHRAAWEFHNGPISEGMTVDHKDHCDRRCVNPAHLREITNYENARKNRSGGDTRLGHCINGHPDNLVARRSKKGRIAMMCLDCERDRNRRYRSGRRKNR